MMVETIAWASVWLTGLVFLASCLLIFLSGMKETATWIVITLLLSSVCLSLSLLFATALSLILRL